MESRERISLLLVEDNDRTAQMAMEFLAAGLTEAEEPLPVDVLRCRTLKATELALRRDHFDASVVDLNLPDSQGLETVKAIRRMNAELPMLVLSSSQEPELTAQLVKAGADGFVSKWLENPLRLTREVLLVLVRRGEGTLREDLSAAVHRRLRDLE